MNFSTNMLNDEIGRLYALVKSWETYCTKDARTEEISLVYKNCAKQLRYYLEILEKALSSVDATKPFRYKPYSVLRCRSKPQKLSLHIDRYHGMNNNCNRNK